MKCWACDKEFEDPTDQEVYCPDCQSALEDFVCSEDRPAHERYNEDDPRRGDR